MDDDLVKRICQQWIDAGYADECFCQMYPGCSAKGNSLTPRMVFDRVEALEAKLAKAVEALVEAMSSQETQQVNSAYEVGQNYMFRSVTHIVTGRLIAVYDDCFVIEDAAWIADTGRYAQAVKTGVFKEVEPYPDGAKVIVNRGALIDAVIIPNLPRKQK